MIDVIIVQLLPLSISDNDAQAINFLLDRLHGKPREAKTTVAEIQATAKASLLMVARLSSDHSIVGMAMLTPSYPKFGKRYAYVENVVSHPNYQRQGIARQLMLCLINEARMLRVTQLQLTSRSERAEAHALYKSLGFEVHETTVFRRKL